jgi:outer membrane lipoprotein-sorting protein
MNMRGRLARRVARIGVLATACGVFAAGSAAAQSVPMPVPRPKADIPNVAPSAPTTPAAPNAQGTAATAPTPAAPGPAESKSFFPFSLGSSGATAPSRATAFDANQRALLDKVSVYLSNLQTLVGNFVQIGPDGRRLEGTFSIQKPGKVRFDYKPPTPIDVVADGSSVVVYDHSLNTSEVYPLSQTPLRYLLANRIDLLRDTNVVSVSADDTFISVVIEETQFAVGTNRLMIMFDAKTLQLKQWTITDPQGLDTTVAVYDLDPNKKPDPNLFVINYTAGLK